MFPIKLMLNHRSSRSLGFYEVAVLKFQNSSEKVCDEVILMECFFNSLQIYYNETPLQLFSDELVEFFVTRFLLNTLGPPDIYLLKVSNWNTRTICEICSKLAIKTPERRHWRHCSRVSIVDFKQVNKTRLCDNCFCNQEWSNFSL